MRIVGHRAELSEREARVLGCGQEEYVARLDCEHALGCLALRRANLDARSLAHASDMPGYALARYTLWRDQRAVEEVAGAVLAHETALYLEHEHRLE